MREVRGEIVREEKGRTGEGREIEKRKHFFASLNFPLLK